jgi:Tol biopolymer transport system component
MHLAYVRTKASTGEHQVMVWSAQSRNEVPVANSTARPQLPYDWSRDAKWLLVTWNPDSRRDEIWQLPVRLPGIGTPNPDGAARKIIADPAYDFYQPHFSPDGRWIVFEATKDSDSTLYVVPAGGGSWVRIGEGKHWDDKPHWSPDGKTIYFLSERGGFLNVWGSHFDAVNGKPVGDPFPVTQFDSPSLMVPTTLPTVELSLTRDKLVLTMEERSGSIWVLDNVGP